jgi:hypothetical protein
VASNVFAQQVFGSIFGTVADPTGAAVAGTKVTITDQNKGTKFEVTTNESGNYTKGNLIPGLYQVEVEHTGFRKAVTPDVNVGADRAVRVDFALQVGNVTESVEVTAAAPLLQSERAEVSTTYTTQQLMNLPSFNRNFQAFEILTPGAQRAGFNHASSENPQGSIQIEVNGQHFSGTSFILDGTDNQDPILGIIVINPTIDSVVETKMASQNYDAEFGLAAAGLMLVSTKSGTNNFHGSLFEFLRNNSPGFSSYARDPFKASEAIMVPPVKWNQFGGSIGGPIIRNKLFAFGDAQISLRRTGSSVNTSVPTAKARTGDLSEYLNNGNNQIYNPTTGDPVTGLGRQPFSGNVIPPSMLDQRALKILTFFPSPNAPGDPGFPYRNNYSATGSENFDSNQWDTRWDWVINEKSSAFGRYSNAGYDKFAPGAFGLLPGGPTLDNINFAGTSNVINRSLAVGYNRTLSPTLLTEIRFGYMRYRVNVLPNGLGTSPAKDAGIPNLNKDDFYTSGMPYFNITGDPGIRLGYALGVNQCNCPLAQREQQYQFVNNTTKIVGNHSYKFGADIRYALQLRVPSDNHRSGELTFANGYTGEVVQGGAVQKGLGLASFLLGDVTGFARYVSSSTDAQERQKRMFWYGQDTWRVTSKLTLNYGLRWEWVFPETVNAPGNGAQLDLRTGEMAVFGVGKTSMHGIQEMSWKHLAPRLGVAYTFGEKMVIRAGYGWSYSMATFGNTFGHNVTQNPPVLSIQNLNAATNFGNVFDLQTGPPDVVLPQPNSDGRFLLPNGIAAKSRPLTVVLPRVMAYNVTVQRQFGQKFVAQAGYVGNVGRHMLANTGQNVNINAPAFIPGLTPNQARPFFAKYGWTQNISHYCNCATSQYDSFQAQATARAASGLYLQVNYTLQRSIVDNNDAYTFNYDRPLGRGTGDWFGRHVFTAAENYELPLGRGKKFLSGAGGVLNAIVGGWGLNGVTTLYTGRPFTPRIGTFPAGFTVRPYTGPSDRPDSGTGDLFAGVPNNRDGFFAGLYKVPGDPASGLNPQWVVPAPNTFGRFPFAGMFGPRLVQQDLSVTKDFKIREGVKLQIRTEAFNAFNHASLAQPNNDLTDKNVGKITGIWPQSEMRRLQFAARVDF